MYTRKQIKSVLKEWKSFLSEAKKKTVSPESEYVVGIFDFDGTIVTYDSEELIDLMKNPYMLNLLNEQFLQEYKERDTKSDKKSTIIPENVKDEISKANEAYICSKVKSLGYDRRIEKSYDGTLKALIAGEQPDANFTNLFEFIKKNSIKNFDILEYITKEIVTPVKESLGDIDPLPQIKVKFDQDLKIQEYLKTAKSPINDEDLKIRTVDLLDRQKKRILQTVTESRLNIPDENIVVTLNIGEQKEVPLDGGGSKMEVVRGTSGKISDVMGIARRVISSLPEGTKITFKLYDNVSSNLGEMMDGVRKALPGYTGVVLKDASSEEEILAFLRERLDESKYYKIVGKEAKPSISNIEYTDPVGRVAKSRKQGDGDSEQESSKAGSYKKQFQQIKNGFQALKLNLIATTGGRPIASVTAAFDETLQKYAGGTVIKLNQNLSSLTATTGLEEEFSKENMFKVFVDEMKKFVSEENYNNFKNTLQPLLDAALSAHGEKKAAKAARSAQRAGTSVETSSEEEIDAAEEADDAFWRNMTSQERDNYERGLKKKKSDDPEVVGYDAWKQKNIARLKESVRRQPKPLLREFKLVLRSKK